MSTYGTEAFFSFFISIGWVLISARGPLDSARFFSPFALELKRMFERAGELERVCDGMGYTIETQ